MATQYPLHYTAFNDKLSMRHQLNRLPIYAKPSVAQYPPNTQAKHSLQSFGLTLTLKQPQPSKLKTLAALEVNLQHTAALIINACTRVNVYQFSGANGKDNDCLEGDADNPDSDGGNKTIKLYYKTSNMLPCNPHGYWSAGRSLFNLQYTKNSSE